MIEPRIKEIQEPKVKYNKEFVNRMIRRIECTVPTAGQGIKVKQLQNGIEISTTLNNVVTLTVCSGGSPFDLAVLTPTQNS